MLSLLGHNKLCSAVTYRKHWILETLAGHAAGTGICIFRIYLYTYFSLFNTEPAKLLRDSPAENLERSLLSIVWSCTTALQGQPVPNAHRTDAVPVGQTQSRCFEKKAAAAESQLSSKPC